MQHICNFCSKEYFPKVKRTNQKFCSRECSSMSFQNRKEKVCKTCNKKYMIPVSADKGINRSKYCSPACRGKFIKELLTKTKETECEVCKVIFEQKPSQKRRFCSIKCYRIYQKSPKWINELDPSGRGSLYSFKRQSLFCVICHSNDTIQIHHKDGDSKNNSVKNWVPLCQTCHHSLHMIHKSINKSLLAFTNSFIKNIRNIVNHLLP